MSELEPRMVDAAMGIAEDLVRNAVHINGRQMRPDVVGAMRHMALNAAMRGAREALGYSAAEIERLTAERDRLREALEDICNPLGYLRRYAESEGAQLNGSAYAIANDLAFVKDIARAALADVQPAGGSDTLSQ